MKTLIIKELTDFKEDVRRDVLVDSMFRPKPANDAEVLMKLIHYGNDYLAREMLLTEHADVVIWFDIHFDHDDGRSEIGMTWAYNPKSPRDPKTGLNFFWRSWSEVYEPNDKILSLSQTQEELLNYLAKGLSE